MKADPPSPVQNRLCADWAEINECLGKLPPATLIDSEGVTTEKAWAFRGTKSSCYELEPTIEREAQSNWPALELLVSEEFKARARMHRKPAISDEHPRTVAVSRYGRARPFDSAEDAASVEVDGGDPRSGGGVCMAEADEVPPK
jgi:hypothetical protein